MGEYFYEGAAYSLDSNKADPYTGYRLTSAELGITTNPTTMNQLKEVSDKLNLGGKSVEMEGLKPEIFDAIPEQHLDEIRRLSKLTGAEVSVHGPLIEASGFTREGWSEAGRLEAENQMLNAVSRSHKLNPQGNISVNFHSSAALPEGEEKIKINGKEVSKSMYAIDSMTGQIRPLEETKRYFPGEKKEFVPKEEINILNERQWSSNISQLDFYAHRGSDSVEHAFNVLTGKRAEIVENAEEQSEREKNSLELYSFYQQHPEVIEQLPEPRKQYFKEGMQALEHAGPSLRDAYSILKELYNRAYFSAERNKDEEAIKKLNAYKGDIEKEVTGIREGRTIENDPAKLKSFSRVIRDGVKVLNSIKTPSLYEPLNNFIIDKSAQSFADVALKSYEKFGETAPIINIENPPAGQFAISRAEELKKLVEDARNKFVEKAVDDKKLSKSEAERVAEKLIGATWDVGHINMLRKYGYDKSDIVKETEKIAPLVKHIHLSDNFGMEHTELPMGMGNVPTKEILEKLKKAGVLEGTKKIVEAGDWWTQLRIAPTLEYLESFSSPLYPMTAGPYWNQIRSTYGNYFGGYGNMLPEQHFSLYGAGFSGLPTELGGQMAGRQRLAGGTPME